MYMSTSSIKKVSAAAVAAVLGLAGISHAASSPVVLPYFTNFTASPDTNGDTYTATSLYTQGNDGSPATGGWVSETGETANTVTVNPTGGVTMNSVYEAPVSSVSQWSDILNSNLADHPAAGAAGNFGATAPLNPIGNGSNAVVVSYNLTVPAGGSTAANGAPAAGFGVRVLDQSDNVIASIFTAPSADSHATNEQDVNWQTGGQSPDNGGAATDLATNPEGGNSYALSINFSARDFTIYVNGVADASSTNIPFDHALPNGSAETIGGITLGTDNLGTNSAVFSDFFVVPEPASIAMLGLGGLMLLAKRRTRKA
jgi:hypothetical protein